MEKRWLKETEGETLQLQSFYSIWQRSVNDKSEISAQIPTSLPLWKYLMTVAAVAIPVGIYYYKK